MNSDNMKVNSSCFHSLSSVPLNASQFSIDVMLQAVMVQETSNKLDFLKGEIENKKKVVKAYSKHITNLESVMSKTKGNKIHQTFYKTDFQLDTKTGELTKIVGNKLAEKDPLFGKKFTPKPALAAEIERLKKIHGNLNKEIQQMESEMNTLIARKKALVADIAKGVEKRDQGFTAMNRKL